MLVYAFDVLGRKMVAEILVVTRFYQPDYQNHMMSLKNAGRLQDFRAIIAISWMEITEPTQVHLLGR